MITIRTAQPEDEHTLLRLWLKLHRYVSLLEKSAFGEVDEAATLQQYQRMISQTLDSDNAAILIAESESQVVATLACFLSQKPGYTRSDSGILYNLWVEPEERRQQTATHLLSEAQRWLKQRGAASAQVAWHPANTLADNFWRKHGYRPYETIAARPL
ncbi:GNAT family N-acetyltransferase [Marinobacterium jannaschii]|uniref:GNAT family N-acetyltransferase n=1 Tax=Marinobacterium jannaschii TaxID=64970 RepID=UPI000481918A|nr:GNAT family N-acetyltransferase [Marinobacterium jannaschii]